MAKKAKSIFHVKELDLIEVAAYIDLQTASFSSGRVISHFDTPSLLIYFG